MRLNNSSTQVYMALKPDEQLDESMGDLFFTSTAPVFRTDLLLSRNVTSRTYSFYYPRTRPHGRPRCLIVSSTNANYSDWANLSEEEYAESKRDLVETTLDHLSGYAGARPVRNVYRRAGRPCRRCGAVVRSHPQGEAARTAYWCPVCQRGGDEPAS